MWTHKTPINPHEPVNPQDIQNCRLLLTFLENSFRGATIGNLKIDDLTKSLKNIFAAIN